MCIKAEIEGKKSKRTEKKAGRKGEWKDVSVIKIGHWIHGCVHECNVEL